MFGQQQQPQTQQSTGFSFGAKPTTTSTPSFGFGNKPATTNTTTNTTPSFGFGNSSSTSTTTPATNGFSLNTSSSTPSAPAASTTGGGFSFGSKPATTSATTTTTGLSFGTSSNTQPSTGGLFGQQNQQQPQLQQAQPPQQNFSSQPSFPWSTNNTSNTTTFGQTTQPQQQQAPIQPIQPLQSTTSNNQSKQHTQNDYTPTINDKLIKIKSSWDGNNPKSTMVTHLYNKVDNSFNNFTRPLNETPEEWENAMKNRPKEYNSIPIKCIGFTGLFERNQLQDNHVKQTRLLLNEINDKLIKLNEKHDLHSNSQLLKCKMRQRNLNIKLLKIAINLSILKFKGYPLTNDEEILILKFKNLLSKLDDPIGLSRVNELWARLTNLKDKYPDNSASLNKSLNEIDINDNKENNENDSDDVIKRLLKILAKQQHGIQFLCELMAEDEAKLMKLTQ